MKNQKKETKWNIHLQRPEETYYRGGVGLLLILSLIISLDFQGPKTNTVLDPWAELVSTRFKCSTFTDKELRLAQSVEQNALNLEVCVIKNFFGCQHIDVQMVLKSWIGGTFLIPSTIPSLWPLSSSPTTVYRNIFLRTCDYGSLPVTKPRYNKTAQPISNSTKLDNT